MSYLPLAAVLLGCVVSLVHLVAAQFVAMVSPSLDVFGSETWTYGLSLALVVVPLALHSALEPSERRARTLAILAGTVSGMVACVAFFYCVVLPSGSDHDGYFVVTDVCVVVMALCPPAAAFVGGQYAWHARKRSRTRRVVGSLIVSAGFLILAFATIIVSRAATLASLGAPVPV